MGAADAQMSRARAGLFGLMARIFAAAPSVELIEAMRGDQMHKSLSDFGVEPDEHFLSGEAAGLAEELAQEYTRLFLGPGPHIAAFESVYVQGERELEPRLWGQATAEVADFYAMIGLGTPAGEPPDRLAREMEAMSLMAQAEAEKVEAGEVAEAARYGRLQQDFCRNHLLHWVPRVCKDIERETASSFYRGMAALTAALVENTCSGGVWSGNVQEEERGLNEDT